MRTPELPLASVSTLLERHPRTGHRIVLNLATMLSRRLIQANNKIDTLTSRASRS